MLIQAEKNALESVLIYVEHIIRYIGKVSSLSGWQFLPAYDIIWKSIIFPACLILTQHQLYLFFYYIQENLNAFNSLLIAERSADAVLSGRRPVQSLCISV